MRNGKKMTLEDLMKKRKVKNLGQVSKGVYNVQFISCGHKREVSLGDLKKNDFSCSLCGKDEYTKDSNKYDGMSKKEICAQSRFTVGFDGDNLGSMIISTGAIESITPERGFYQALYNNPKNNPKLVNELTSKLNDLGIFSKNLYDDTPNSVFGQQLDLKGHAYFLKDYENTKRRGKSFGFVMPEVVKKNGVKALKAYKAKNQKG